MLTPGSDMAQGTKPQRPSHLSSAVTLKPVIGNSLTSITIVCTSEVHEPTYTNNNTRTTPITLKCSLVLEKTK
ncbi:hypothetical protein EYC84_003108 [Monilinia fructicola]|uniref:Uncharacterized protein n=1 Tax=Monilinia fructicola TaxID=38448 RepID=A0A5M9JSL2_MONFR|nr:hypothetical protein EYC84_003108 [Monilinia fructicola]